MAVAHFAWGLPAAVVLAAALAAALASCSSSASAPEIAVQPLPVDQRAEAANATLNAVLTQPAGGRPQPVDMPAILGEDTGTSSPVPPSPTATPPGDISTATAAPTAALTLTPTQPPTSTPTPTPSATPTLNWDATQTAQAQEVAAAVAATLAAQATVQAQQQAQERAMATAVAATLTAQATPTPPPTPSPEPPTPQPTPTTPAARPLLAFVYGDVGDTDIQVYDPATAHVWPVADRACDEAEPEWMPDGRSIVYQADCDGSYDIYLADVETRSTRRLTATGNQDEREPDISPDGRRLVYRANREQDARNVDGELWVLNLGGGDPQPLGVSGRSPSWSPDGTQLLFMSERTGGWDVYVYSPADRSTLRLTDCAANCRFPAWSPDGRSVVYHSTTGSTTAEAETIWRVAAAGGDPVLLVTGDGAGRPTWSADGWIAFNSQRGIEMVDEQGRQRRTLLADNSHWAPAWSR